jgi:hypothetical protein
VESRLERVEGHCTARAAPGGDAVEGKVIASVESRSSRIGVEEVEQTREYEPRLGSGGGEIDPVDY